MITPELIDYIKKQKEKNISEEEITSKLSTMGWHKEDIEEGFGRVVNLGTTFVPSIPKKSDPYREPVMEVKEKPKEEFIPTLKPKEVEPAQTTFNPIIPNTITPNTIIQDVPLRNTPVPDIPKIITPNIGQYNTPIKTIEVKKTGGVPKIAIWIFIIFVLGAILGGAIFAYNKGLINIPGISKNTPINIPFITPSPEKIAEKALALVPDINTNNIEGTVSFSIKEVPPVNFEGQIKFIDGIIYLISPQLMQILEENPKALGSWVSFDTRNIQLSEAINDNVGYIEEKINENILEISKKLSNVKELIKDPNFINSVKILSDETLNEKIMSHYQFDITLDSRMDVWVNKETDIIKKFQITLTNERFNIVSSFTPLNTNQLQLSVIPENSRPFKDFADELSVKLELINKDKILKNSVNAISSEAELYKEKFKSYGKANTTGSCVKPAIGSLFYASATNTKAKPINDIVKLILGTTNNQGACYSTDKAWAVAFPLFSNSNTYYCVDSIGVKQEITAPLTKTFCPQVETTPTTTPIPDSTPSIQ